IIISQLSVIVLIFSGFLAVLAVRPANRAGDLAVGMASSLIAGVTYFAVGWAPFCVWLGTLSPTQGDWSALDEAVDELSARAVPGQPQGDKLALPSAALVARYPDLREVAAPKAWKLVLRKINADLVARSAHGIWLGLLFVILIPLLNVPLAYVAGHR